MISMLPDPHAACSTLKPEDPSMFKSRSTTPYTDELGILSRLGITCSFSISSGRLTCFSTLCGSFVSSTSTVTGAGLMADVATSWS